MTFGEAFDSEFTIDDGNDDTAITRRQSTIYNQYIARMNPRLPHGLASYPNEKGCCRMLNEVLIEVKGAIEVSIGWRRING